MIKYLVYGFGITGRSVARYLSENDIPYDICDKDKHEKDIFSPKEINIKEYSHVVVSPGIPPEDELVIKSMKNDVIITSELQMAYERLRSDNNRFIAVTGTNGKSTTASLIYSLIKAGSEKDVFLAGNIGNPLIETVSKRPKDAHFIVEISSYQTQYLFDFAPDIVILLNLSPDHLARHKTMKAYHDAKVGLLAGMKDGTVLYNDEDFDIDIFKNIEKKAFKKDFFIRDGRFFYEDTLIYENLRWRLPGKHNEHNICFSLACLEILGINGGDVKKALADFDSLEHRMEKIYDDDSLVVYNDSKATTFESTLAAVSSFEKAVHLILCGRIKEGMDIDKFIKELVEYKNIDKIIILGDVNDEITFEDDQKIIRSGDDWFDFFHAYLLNVKEGVLLFSPGMPSFDMFNNFEERGAFFKKVIHLVLKDK